MSRKTKSNHEKNSEADYDDVAFNLSVDEVVSILKQHFGLDAENLKQLDSYEDKNFFFSVKNVECVVYYDDDEDDDENNNDTPPTSSPPSILSTITPATPGFVFKVTNAFDSRHAFAYEAQTSVISHVRRKCRRHLEVQRTVATLTGQPFAIFPLLSPTHEGSTSHLGRVLTFLPGIPLKFVDCTAVLFVEAGRAAARIDEALEDFEDKVFDDYRHRDLWQTLNVGRILGRLDYSISADAVTNGVNRRRVVREIVAAIESRLAPLLGHMTPRQIHGDLNEGNLILRKKRKEEEKEEKKEEFMVGGVIDFSETYRGYWAFEIGLFIAYLMLECPPHLHPLDIGGLVQRGFVSLLPLSPADRAAVAPAAAARLAASLVRGAVNARNRPGNEHISYTQIKGWEVLTMLWEVGFDGVEERWRVVEGGC